MNVTVEIPVSVGELVDKLTILALKMEHIKDEKLLAHVEKEACALQKVYDRVRDSFLDECFDDLLQANDTLWHIEDKVRECERHKDFGDTFVQQARLVYLYNDKRSEIKRLVNERFSSDIVEAKSYTSY